MGIDLRTYTIRKECPESHYLESPWQLHWLDGAIAHLWCSAKCFYLSKEQAVPVDDAFHNIWHP